MASQLPSAKNSSGLRTRQEELFYFFTILFNVSFIIYIFKCMFYTNCRWAIYSGLGGLPENGAAGLFSTSRQWTAFTLLSNTQAVGTFARVLAACALSFMPCSGSPPGTGSGTTAAVRSGDARRSGPAFMQNHGLAAHRSIRFGVQIRLRIYGYPQHPQYPQADEKNIPVFLHNNIVGIPRLQATYPLYAHSLWITLPTKYVHKSDRKTRFSIFLPPGDAK